MFNLSSYFNKQITNEIGFFSNYSDDWCYQNYLDKWFILLNILPSYQGYNPDLREHWDFVH